MTYADSRYIHVARKTELVHHEHAMEQLRLKVEQLSKAVSWELQQHQTRLQELQRAEETLSVPYRPHDSKNMQSTLQPTPSATGKTSSQENVFNGLLKNPLPNSLSNPDMFPRFRTDP